MLPSKFLFDLIINVWEQPSGRIFLLSAAYYLFSTFAVGGYMAYFSGGFGNIGFGDYSLIEFLFFLPTLTVTALSIFYDNFWRVAGNFLLYLIAPNFAGLLIAYWLSRIPDLLNLLSALPLFLITTLFSLISLISWLVGVTMLLSGTRYNQWIPFLLQFLGALLLGITAVMMVTKGIPPPSIHIDPVLLGAILFLGDLLILITGIGGLLLVIILVGITIAREAIKYEYLSKVISMELTQVVSGLEKWRIQIPNTAHNSFWSLFKSKEVAPVNYQYNLNGEVLLIASLKRVTALYVHESGGTFIENGRLILVSNNNILSLELKSGKKLA